MKVNVIDKDTFEHTLNSVTSVICCEDGRHLIIYKEICPCCNQEAMKVFHLPSWYKIELVLEKKDKVNLTSGT